MICNKIKNCFHNFFLYLSVTDPDAIKIVSRHELYIQVILGMQIFITSLLAFFSCAYAMNLVFENQFYSLVIGIIWAIVILNTDRLIISTFHKTGSVNIEEGQVILNFLTHLFKFFIRLFLACFISFVIAIPLELKIFESEIDIYLLRKSQIENYSLSDSINLRVNRELKNKSNELVFQLEIRKDLLEKLQNTPIYLTNKESRKVDANRYDEITKSSLNPEYTNLSKQYKEKEQEIGDLEKEIEKMKDTLTIGYNKVTDDIQNQIRAKEEKSIVTRITSLVELKDNSNNKTNSKGSKFYIFWSLPLIIFFIEILPVFLKWLSGESQYTSILKMNDRRTIKQNNEKE